jgi:hypothetical protein
MRGRKRREQKQPIKLLLLGGDLHKQLHRSGVTLDKRRSLGTPYRSSTVDGSVSRMQ